MSIDTTGLVETFTRGLSSEAALQIALRELLVTTNARAVALYLLENKQLKLLGFDGAADMPHDVRQSFVQATSTVSLTQMDLGIVRAATKIEPVVARVAVDERGLSGSASWIGRFGATESIAVPIQLGRRVVGVVAVSTVDEIKPGTDVWEIVTGLARGLGEPLSRQHPRIP